MTETNPKINAKTTTRTPRKTTPKKEVVEKIVSEEKVEVDVQQETVIEAIQTVAKAEKRQFSKNDDVEIMNNTTGRYGYIGRSGFSIEMNEYGDTLEIPFGELKAMKGEQKRHIEEAFIVILDEDAIKELRLEKLYENILDLDGVEEILQDHEKLDKILNKMPSTMRETIGSIAVRKFKSGELYDKRVQKVIEDNLKIKIDD